MREERVSKTSGTRHDRPPQRLRGRGEQGSFVGADPCVRPNQGRRLGLPLQEICLNGDLWAVSGFRAGAGEQDHNPSPLMGRGQGEGDPGVDTVHHRDWAAFIHKPHRVVAGGDYTQHAFGGTGISAVIPLDEKMPVPPPVYKIEMRSHYQLVAKKVALPPRVGKGFPSANQGGQ